MPKVLIVIARLNVGGTAQYIGELVRGLASSQFQVLVATGHVQGAEVEDEIVNDIPLVRIPAMGRRISLVSDIKARRQIKQVIREFQPDLIYSHTFKAGLLCRSFKSDTPRAHAFHGHLLSDPEFQGFKSRVGVWIERFLAKKSSVLVTVGERVASELLQEKIGSANQYHSIAPGVQEIFLVEKDKARELLGITSESRPIVVWMARVTHVKGPERVVDMARAIPEVRFLMAGGGDQLGDIKKIAPSNLTVLGWQSAAIMWSVADLAISTSFNEGMPVALIEAQMAGVPVIAVDAGSVAEVVADKLTGYVFHEFGIEYIEKVRELTSDSKKLKELGEAAKQRSELLFSPKTLVGKHIKLFDDLIARRL